MPRPPAKRRRYHEESTLNGEKVDNSGHTIKKLSELYHYADLCDVHLQLGRKTFFAHKLILSISSDVFKTMLNDVQWAEARSASIRLHEPQECQLVFGEFLAYLYTGSIHLTNRSVLPLLVLADKYNICHLGEECKRYMVSHCHHADLPNIKVVSWQRYAMLFNEKKMESVFRQYMELNFSHVIQSDDFLTMPQNILEEFLNCQQLVLDSEYTLFTQLKRWCLYNRDTSIVYEEDAVQEFSEASSAEYINPCESNESNAVQMMKYIRFPIMKHSRLLALCSDTFVQENAGFFKPRLQEAVNAHMRHRYMEMRMVCSTNIDDVTTVSGGSRSSCSPKKNTSSAASSHSSTGSRIVVCPDKQHSGVVSCGAECREVCSSIPASEAHTSIQREHVNTCGNPMRDAVCSALCLSSPASEADTSMHSEHSNALCRSPVCNLYKGSSVCYIPRNYTCEDWSSFVAVEDFASFPSYGSHAYFFATPACAVASYASSTDRHEEMDDSAMLEWQAELYPRGVCFPRAQMIGIPTSFDIDETCRDMVRLAIHSRTQCHQPCRVDVVVLAFASGLADGSEYVANMTQKTCIFDDEHTVHNIDDIVPFQELNRTGSKYLTDSLLFPGRKSSCFKLKIIIKPKH